MKSDLFGALRAAVMVILIGLAVLCSITERNLKQEPHSPPMKSSEPLPKKAVETWSSLGTFQLTAYCPCEKCCGYWATVRAADPYGTPIVYTASGAVAKDGITIAVDPSIIPYGSVIKINNKIYIAQDTGADIKNNRIDIYKAEHGAALAFGVQEAEVFIKEEKWENL